MSNTRRNGLLASILAIGCLGVLIDTEPARAQGEEPREVRDARRRQRQADERQLKRNCSKKLKDYQLREGELQGAKNRGQADDVISTRQKARDQALKELCKCLEQFYGVYGDLPAEYMTEELDLMKLCFPPGGLPADPGPGVDPETVPPPGQSGPPDAAPPEPLTTNPCQRAWEDYKNEEAKWDRSSANVDFVMYRHHLLCECLKQHYGEPLPLEWQKFCNPDRPYYPPPELPIIIYSAENSRPPIYRRQPQRPAEGAETPGPGPNRRGAEPRPRSPRSGAPGSEPRSLAPGDCDAQRGAYGRLLADYRRAMGAERQSLRPALENAYRELCECLRITAPDQYERFCRWQGQTDPPDMPPDWPPPVSIAPPPPPAAPQPTCRLDGRRVFQWVVVSDPQNSARFITEIPNPLALDFQRESAPGEAPDVRYGVTIPGQPPITGMLNVSACAFKASWQGPAARRQNRPYDLTLNWPGGTDGAAQGDLTVEPRDNVPRDIVKYGLTATPGP